MQQKKTPVIKQIYIGEGRESTIETRPFLFKFTVNKDNWPVRREYLRHVTIIMQNGGLPAMIANPPKSLPSFKHGSYIQ